MKKYVTPNELKRIENIKGQVLESENGVVMVKTADIYSVWMPETGLIVCHTFDIKEAADTYIKFKGQYMSHKQLCDIYLDYINNFLSVKGFASYYDLSDELAKMLISKAREIYQLTYP
jgi:hypothetical protein